MPLIRVTDEVHELVKQIADANFRGMGDQVAFWAANECPHPTEMREEKVVAVAPVEKGKAGAENTLRILYCKQCHRHTLLGDPNQISKTIGRLPS